MSEEVSMEKVISSRPDRELFKKLITPGDYTIVPFEDSRCKISLTDVSFGEGDLVQGGVEGGDRGTADQRFHKALKMLIAIEPFDPDTIHEEKVKELIDLKVKLYNNLAHCQLQYNEYAAALELCSRALSFHPDSVKALYRRCVAYSQMQMYEEAWKDIQRVLQLDPSDSAAQQKATELKPRIQKMNTEYST
ncbi:Uncharacterized protein OBRU01_19112, partial [Operophtera brumata]